MCARGSASLATVEGRLLHINALPLFSDELCLHSIPCVTGGIWTVFYLTLQKRNLFCVGLGINSAALIPAFPHVPFSSSFRDLGVTLESELTYLNASIPSRAHAFTISSSFEFCCAPLHMTRACGAEGFKGRCLRAKRYHLHPIVSTCHDYHHKQCFLDPISTFILLWLACLAWPIPLDNFHIDLPHLSRWTWL